MLSLQTYATATGDATAATLASQLEQSAAASVSRFDTGYWTYYSLGGAPTPLSYQKFIVQLLQKLAPQDPRFARGGRQLCGVSQAATCVQARDTSPGALRFWLSKPSLVTVSTPSGLGRSLRLNLLARLAHASLERAQARRVLRRSRDSGRLCGQPCFVRRPPGRPRGGEHVVRFVHRFGSGRRACVVPVRRRDRDRRLRPGGSCGLARPEPRPPDGHLAVRPDDAGSRRRCSRCKVCPRERGSCSTSTPPQLPTGDAGRTALADYAASLAQQTPALRDLVLTPAPQRSDAAGYADALAAVRTGVRSRDDRGRGRAVPRRVDGQPAAHHGRGGARARTRTRPRPTSSPSCPRRFRLPERGPSAIWASLESALAQGLGKAPPVLLDAVPSSTTEVAPAAQAAGYASAIEAARACRT